MTLEKKKPQIAIYSKTYKITMQKARKDLFKSFEQKIRNLKSTNPKQYWKILNSNKHKWNDGVLNEYICSTINIFLSIFKNLFNHILISGNIPEEWVIGSIIPVYKNKGDRSSPENYRGISLLSCFGNFITSLINTRLTNFLNSNKILLETQTGFKRGYSTMDHVFYT